MLPRLDGTLRSRQGTPALVRFALRAGLLCVALLCTAAANAQDDSGETKPPTASPAEDLAERQRQIAEQYEQLEQILLRMAELSAAADPRRAALLKKTVAESKQRLIGTQFAHLVEQLGDDRLSAALEGQEKLHADLDVLLELLLSENRSERIESEKARIRGYLKQLNRIINQQKGLQARTTGGQGSSDGLAKEQGELGNQTEGLSDEIRRNEEPDPEDSSDTAAGGEPKENDEGKQGDSPDASDGNSPQESPSPGEEPAGGEQGEPSEQTPEGEPAPPNGSGNSPGGPQPPGPPPDDAHPARPRLDEARKRMQQAQQRLEQSQRDGAADEQEEAIRELQQAKAELEEILRQLREEEIEQVLVALEARLVKMLQMQREVYDGTERLDKASADGLTHDQEIEAGRLSSREAEIVDEAERALLLLREDGTAVAFPEALSQASDDMRQVVDRLAKAKVGQITLALEEDIVVALEEMLEAVRAAIEEAEQRQSQSPPGQPGPPQEPALIDLLSELRMIRALQMRVNTRTERYRSLISGPHAETIELREALRELAERQARVVQITRDLELGRNQ